jgi:two-component system NtrC family sensor kinase
VLWGRGKVLGVLEIGKRSSHDFENQYEVLLQSICHQFALAIEQVRLYREVSDAYENLRLAQEQLLQTEKMASVGQLTAGVAHELNNPLTALLGYISLIKGLEISDEARGLVEKLHAQTKRMHNIIQNLLSFSRQQKPRKDPVSILRVLESTLALREYEMRAKNIRIESEVEFPLPMVMADANQLEQVFLNIVNNAIDAMLGQKGQGTLKINVAFLENHLSVKFHDSGPGLSDLKRIFDPFYTTKPVGKGTGLGLSICDGLVKEHGGEIIPRNPPEGGAEFSINLPVVMNPAITCERRIKQSIGGRRKLAGRVLVLDPDPVCKALLAETLTTAGFRVVMPRDGEDAIKLLSQEIPDALVLEATGSRPPEGMDVYLWVQQNRPELAGRVVMTVGSSTEGKVRRFVQDHSLVYVAKPFEMLDLVEKLQAVMERQKYKTAAISCSA